MDPTGPLVCRGVSLCAIFDDLQSVRARQVEDGIHVAWPARKMNRNDGLRPRCENFADRLHSDVLAVGIHIGHHGTRPNGDGATCRSHKCPAGGDHLVAGPDAESPQRRFQRHSSVGESDSVTAAAEVGELALELAAFVARPIVDLPAAQHGRGCLDLIRSEVRPGRKLNRGCGRRLLRGRHNVRDGRP